jgi:hypothetical protein
MLGNLESAAFASLEWDGDEWTLLIRDEDAGVQRSWEGSMLGEILENAHAEMGWTKPTKNPLRPWGNVTIQDRVHCARCDSKAEVRCPKCGDISESIADRRQEGENGERL